MLLFELQDELRELDRGEVRRDLDIVDMGDEIGGT